MSWVGGVFEHGELNSEHQEGEGPERTPCSNTFICLSCTTYNQPTSINRRLKRASTLSRSECNLLVQSTSLLVARPYLTNDKLVIYRSQEFNSLMHFLIFRFRCRFYSRIQERTQDMVKLPPPSSSKL